MDLVELRSLARSLEEVAFLERFPHLFFLFHHVSGEAEPIAFETGVVDPRELLGKQAGALRVLPIRKARNSPYADRISIGRARNCDVILRDPSVSKLHAHVRKDDDGSAWVLLDLGSHNGTKVDDARLRPNQPTKIPSGILVTIGAVTLRVVDASALRTILTGLPP